MGLIAGKDIRAEVAQVRTGPMTLTEAMNRQFVKRGKYGNEKTPYKGRMYDSKREAAYAMELDTLMKARSPKERVVKWTPQVRFTIKVKGQKICDYYADFVVEYADGRSAVIDVKGVMTDVYKLKKKLVKAVHGIDIQEA